MAKLILATTPLSHNDSKSLAELFSSAFLYCKENTSQINENEDFIHHIRTVIGLSFTATLVNGDLLNLFNRSLWCFLRHQYSANSCIGSLKVGMATSDIVTLGSDFFRLLNHPRYYDDFLQALRDSLSHIIGEMGIPVSAEAEHVIELIYNDP